MTQPVSVLASAWLLTRLRLRRLLNQTSAVYNRPLNARKGRPATPAKNRNPWLVTGFVSIAMLFSFGNLARQAIVNLHLVLDLNLSGRMLSRGSARMPEIFSAVLSRGLTMELSLLFVIAVLMSLGTRELAQPDWDLEWLVTLPTRMRALLWIRIIERSLANPVGILTLAPTCVLIAWFSGYRWTAPLMGVAIAIPLLFLTALARTLVDTGLRLKITPSRLRNLQATTSVVSILLLYFAMSAGLPTAGGFFFDLARQFPQWPQWLPTGLAVQTLNAPGVAQTLQGCLLLFAESALILYIGIRLLESQLRHGVVAASSRESTRQSGLRPKAAPAVPTYSFASAIQRRELKLLARDRNYLVQSLVLPVIIIGSQLFITGSVRVTSLAASATTTASIAFGLAAYMLLLSAFQALNSEKGALWILFTVPRSLQSILYEKTQLWASLALIYPIAVFAAGIYISHRVDSQLLGLGAVVLLGVPIYASIAVSLGVFGCDPLAQEAQAKISITYVYLYMILSGLYTYAIFASAWSQRLVLIMLSGLLATALWQKTRDELPYLLDPAASPPARVSTSDGIIAAMLFFVFQGVAALVMGASRHPLTAFQIVVAFSIAGAITYVAVRLTYWRSETQEVPSILNRGVRIAPTLGWGCAAGLTAALCGLIYIVLVQRLGLMEEVSNPLAITLSRSALLVALAVIAAPLFEEFIFRGLIFGGLRRSLPTAQAVLLSAAVFALVHPPVSMIPVFVLGICAAVAYHRSKVLLAPMLTHAIYNAIIVGYQFTR
jgi:ABC-2 type transport system permease protein